MFSRTKVIASLIAAPAVVAALLVFSPAQAGGAGTRVVSTNIAVTSGNSTATVLTCLGAKTCAGTAWFGPVGNTTWENRPFASYSIKANSTATIKIPVGPEAEINPNIGSGGELNAKSALLIINQKLPAKAPIYATKVNMEKQIASRRVSGTVTGDMSGISKLRVSRWYVKGLQSTRQKTVDIGSDGKYDLGLFALGANNAWVWDLRLSVSAYVDGEYREWFWRGDANGNGAFTGGAKGIREATPVRPAKYRDFVANFKFGRISGNITGNDKSPAPGAEIRVSAPPAVMPTNAADLRDLDIQNCANDFGSTTANGSGGYSVNFLPKADGTDKRYMVRATPASGTAMALWNNKFRSCFAARGYAAQSNAELIDIPDAGVGKQDFAFRQGTGKISLKASYGFRGGSVNDRAVTVREYIPGKRLLDTPATYNSYLQVDGTVDLVGIPPGQYWIEIGRDTSCSAWYQSLYPDNNLYLEGADRGAERWKTVNGEYAEYSKSITMGFPKTGKKPPSGYKGWMYREYCRAGGTGYFKPTPMTLSDGGTQSLSVHNPLGATISGHIDRGSKSNKEMLVSVYSTGGLLVMRTAYSGASGNFKVTGLAPGNYNVMVNADSWRGIGRTFSGVHTKRVEAGKTYNIGTLKASF